MELIQHHCKNCGGSLFPVSEGKLKCQNCGSTFDTVSAEKHTKQMKELFDDAKQETIHNLRRNLYDTTHAEFVSSTEVHNICATLKQYLPDDFQANFYDVATGSNVRQLTDVVRKIDVEKHYDDLEGILQYLIRSLQTEYLLELNNLVERAYKQRDLEKFEQYSTAISEEADKVLRGVYETKLPRDVFIAYSGKDMEKVSELVEELEKQGLSCFVAARNLRHGAGAVEHYDRALQEAMDNCRSFVFVSSANSRSLSCDAITKEIPYVKGKDIENAPAEYRNNYAAIPHQYKKPRVEYRIDARKEKTAGDSISDAFFEGYEWVYNKKEVANRIAAQLYETPVQPANVTPPPQPAKPVKQATPVVRKNKKTVNRRAILIPVAILLLIGMIALVVVLSKRGDSGDLSDGNKTVAVGEQITLPEYEHLVFTMEEGGYSVQIAEGKAGSLTGELVIPAEIGGTAVVSIPGDAFLDCKGLTSVTIPDNITNMGYGAFDGCTSLTEITVPFIGKSDNAENPRWAVLGYMFGDSVEDGGMSTDKTIRKTSDSGSYTSQVSEGGDYFCYEIPKSLRKVTVTNQTVIPKNAFYNCDLIESVFYTQSITSIGENAFGNCAALKDFTLPEQLQTIEDGSFFGCKSLSSIDLPDSVTSIGHAAFRGCAKLTEVVVPDSVKFIGHGAFGDCPDLTEITLPFVGRTLEPDAENPRWSVFGYIFGDGDQEDSMAADTAIYKTSGTSGFTSQISEDSKNTFYYKIPRRLKTVTVTTQTVVPDYAFNNCDLIESITFSQPLQSIGKYAFAECTELAEFTISATVTTIGDAAFYNCKKFTAIDLPSNLSSIGTAAFFGCSKITSFVVPDNVKYIGGGAFGGCSSLAEITLPFVGKTPEPDTENLRWSVFGYIFGDEDPTDGAMQSSATIYKTSGTDGFTSQFLYEGSKYFYFQIPKSLKKVTVTVQTEIPDFAFYNCDLLEEIVFSSITSQGANSFTGCTATVTPS